MGNDNGSGFAPAIEFDGVRVFHGDCREVLKALPDNSVDSIVTDPPYGLSNTTPELVSKTIVRWVSGDRDFIPTGAGFMGKEWDSFVPPPAVWDECLRVLKPGGHLLAFFGSRTMDLGQLAIRLAGFEIRDNVAWLYGSGFPKSLDVSKAIDKKLGVEREKVRKKYTPGTSAGNAFNNDVNPRNWLTEARKNGFHESDGPVAATRQAEEWQGWGTALKPAFEPIVVGRKPLVGTVAENVLEWGVGGLNIDGSRIAGEKVQTTNGSKNDNYGDLSANAGQAWESAPQGRWPANVILDEHTAGLLDEQSGEVKSAGKYKNPGTVKQIGSRGWQNNDGFLKQMAQKSLRDNSYANDTGGASWFFYVAKASKRDRNEGLEQLEARAKVFNGQSDKPAGNAAGSVEDKFSTQPAKNFHPTVKPTQLMRYLIKLVTPPGGTVLDPFTGSGSTGKAAILDGFGFVGAELTEEYLPIIEGRLKWALENRETDETLF